MTPANIYSNGVDANVPVYADIALAPARAVNSDKGSSSNIYSNNDTVIYSQLQNPNTPNARDVYANVKR